MGGKHSKTHLAVKVLAAVFFVVTIIFNQDSYILRSSFNTFAGVHSPYISHAASAATAEITEIAKKLSIGPSSLKQISANYKIPENSPQPPVKAQPTKQKAEPSEYESIEKSISHISGDTGISKDVTIKNQTSYAVSADEINGIGLPFRVTAEKPTVLILHTHGTEAYTPSEKYNFTYTTNSRTTDTDYNVVRVGTELERELQSLGESVIHDVNMYDYPDYNSSYDNAFYGIRAMLRKYPSVSVVLDIHRDAINTDDGKKVKLAADINGEKAAQVMFVVGTDECGFSHPYWRDNLKFAAMIQGHLTQNCPQLVRPINLRTSRFNQHFTKGSLIIEVGTNGNTLDEALVSAKYLATAIHQTLDELRS